MVQNRTLRIGERKKTGPTQTQSFKIQKSKALSDEIGIGIAPAEHYGFTAEELDHINKYDIKYRMGSSIKDNDD